MPRVDLYALNPNQGDLDRITPQGQISRVLDTSAVYGHIVPTALAYHGNFYIGNLGTFPPTQGSQSIYKVTPSGQSKVDVKGLTAITGMTFDNRNRLYVLQTTAVSGFFAPGNWRRRSRKPQRNHRDHRDWSVVSSRYDIRSGWRTLCLELRLRLLFCAASEQRSDCAHKHSELVV